MTGPATAATTTPLAALRALGTSAWLDSIRRGMIETGELGRLVSEDSVVGVTSNPSIFEQAILGSPDYDRRLGELAGEGASVPDTYEALAIEDVQGAADVLAGVYEATAGGDGYVSLEVAPALARDTDGTLAAARDLWARVGRPNAMIKIPGTAEGLPAVTGAVDAGVNVNITLLFAVDAYEAVVDAFMTGLERRAARGEPLDRIASVASFFVSRIDTAVDRHLAELGHDELAGRAAVANAQLAYTRCAELYAGDRWAALAAAGARPQRLLWASTGTKDARYSDTKYVTELAGPNVVNTMPLATLRAYQDHGAATDRLSGTGPEARRTIDELAAAGISLTDVTDTLLEEGVASFATAMDKLLAGIEQRRQSLGA